MRGVIQIFGFHWKRPGKAQIFVPPLVPSPPLRLERGLCSIKCIYLSSACVQFVLTVKFFNIPQHDIFSQLHHPLIPPNEIRYLDTPSTLAGVWSGHAGDGRLFICMCFVHTPYEITTGPSLQPFLQREKVTRLAVCMQWIEDTQCINRGYIFCNVTSCARNLLAPYPLRWKYQRADWKIWIYTSMIPTLTDMYVVYSFTNLF